MSRSRIKALPLQGIKVLEFTHAILGPACGMVLADLGADIIHVEAPQGDP
ncbi:MAG: CoA transferase, partial [Acidobacteria bacterium]|nr:CoA transferase [Acidobacteriota bacterium]